MFSPLLILVCAHRWEAQPFLNELNLKLLKEPSLPFPLYANEQVKLILTGSGSQTAALIVSGFLAHLFEKFQLKCGGGLMAAPVLIANFGTCAGASLHWKIATSVLVNRILEPTAKRSVFPERHVTTNWPEATCRTVLEPATSDQGLGTDVVDMEAYGVAQATESYLSTSHLLVGKFVLDNPGHDSGQKWHQLVKGLEQPYTEASLDFLDLARAHLEFLSEDPRRNKAMTAQLWVQKTLEGVLESVPFTVTQTRQLSGALRAAAGNFEVPSQYDEKGHQIRAVLAQAERGTKHANTIILQRLQQLLAAPL